MVSYFFIYRLGFIIWSIIVVVFFFILVADFTISHLSSFLYTFVTKNIIICAAIFTTLYFLVLSLLLRKWNSNGFRKFLVSVVLFELIKWLIILGNFIRILIVSHFMMVIKVHNWFSIKILVACVDKYHIQVHLFVWFFNTYDNHWKDKNFVLWFSDMKIKWYIIPIN